MSPQNAAPVPPVPDPRPDSPQARVGAQGAAGGMAEVPAGLTLATDPDSGERGLRHNASGKWLLTIADDRRLALVLPLLAGLDWTRPEADLGPEAKAAWLEAIGALAELYWAERTAVAS